MNVADSDAVYRPLHGPAPSVEVVEVLRDMAYGPDARNLLDISFERNAHQGQKVAFVFVHGGGFTTGDRRRQGTPFHDNVMFWAVNEGMIGVNVTYRLAPQHSWPSGGLDVLAALDWVVDNIERWGGDSRRVIVLGHSAGAAHVAEALARAHAERCTVPWAGTILLSGIYSPADYPPTSAREAYYGPDTNLWHARGLIPRLAATPGPLMIASSELEPPEFVREADALCAALREHGGACQREVLSGHNHFSPVLSLGSTDRSFSLRLKAFIKAITSESN